VDTCAALTVVTMPAMAAARKSDGARLTIFGLPISMADLLSIFSLQPVYPREPSGTTPNSTNAER
jgi:hypothetical protein